MWAPLPSSHLLVSVATDSERLLVKYLFQRQLFRDSWKPISFHGKCDDSDSFVWVFSLLGDMLLFANIAKHMARVTRLAPRKTSNGRMGYMVNHQRRIDNLKRCESGCHLIKILPNGVVLFLRGSSPVSRFKEKTKS